MLTELFCSIDDFLKSQKLNPVKAIKNNNGRNRLGSLSTRELVIMVVFQQSSLKKLCSSDIKCIAAARKNINNKPTQLFNKSTLRKLRIIEIINDNLKNLSLKWSLT